MNAATAIRPQPEEIPIPEVLPEPRKIFKDNPTKEAETQTALLSQLDARRIDFANPPTEPLPVVKFRGMVVSTAGNLTNLAGGPKTGKTAVIGALIAGAMADLDPWKTLGLEITPNKEGKALVHFDCEQSPFDSFELTKRACRRAELDAPPPWLRAYSLADMGTEERRAALALELERAADECGGLYLVILDGIGDLCRSLNDEQEALGLVEHAHELAIAHRCPMWTIIHENPGSDKTRGHLGSQLERKAESNIRLKKNEVEETVIFTGHCRRGHVTLNDGVWFRFVPEAGMHVRFSPVRAKTSRERKREEDDAVLDKVFRSDESLAWSQIVKRQVACNIKTGTAENNVTRWEKSGLVCKLGTLYHRKLSSMATS